MSAVPRPALDLSVSVAGIELKNPVIAASGTFGYGVEFEDIVALSRIGGFVVKGLSREPMPGNPPPRLFETAAGMLNAIGLQNIGVRAFLEEKLPLLQKIKDIVFFCNVFGHSQDEYEDVVRAAQRRAKASPPTSSTCRVPTPSAAASAFGSDPRMLFDVVSAVQEAGHAAADREAVAQRHQHSRCRARRRGRRGRCHLAGEYLRRHGHRCGDAQAAHLQRHRRAVRSGHQADRACAWSGKRRRRFAFR